MKRPIAYESLTPLPGEISKGPIPPSGFQMVWEAECGNGDYFGLYWPIGRESEEPIICETRHDIGILSPAFSSTQKFVDWIKLNDGERGDLKIKDSTFGPEHFLIAHECISHAKTEEAIHHLQMACESIPDFSGYWLLLAEQLRRTGQRHESINAAMNSYRSGWHFGVTFEPILRLIRTARNSPEFQNDPIVMRSNELTGKYGGMNENPNYALLKESVDEYLIRGQYLKAIQVYHNYAYMMTGETSSFQERAKFNLSTWQVEFSRLCKTHLGDGRVSIE